jgi:hypothetical protein
MLKRWKMFKVEVPEAMLCPRMLPNFRLAGRGNACKEDQAERTRPLESSSSAALLADGSTMQAWVDVVTRGATPCV